MFGTWDILIGLGIALFLIWILEGGIASIFKFIFKLFKHKN